MEILPVRTIRNTKTIQKSPTYLQTKKNKQIPHVHVTYVNKKKQNQKENCPLSTRGEMNSSLYHLWPIQSVISCHIFGVATNASFGIPSWSHQRGRSLSTLRPRCSLSSHITRSNVCFSHRQDGHCTWAVRVAWPTHGAGDGPFKRAAASRLVTLP